MGRSFRRQIIILMMIVNIIHRIKKVNADIDYVRIVGKMVRTVSNHLALLHTTVSRVRTSAPLSLLL